MTATAAEGTRPQPPSTRPHRTALFSTRYRERLWDASCRSALDYAAFPRLKPFLACDAHRPRYGTCVRQDNSLQPKEIQQHNPSSASALYVPLPHSASYPVAARSHLQPIRLHAQPFQGWSVTLNPMRSMALFPPQPRQTLSLTTGPSETP